MPKLSTGLQAVFEGLGPQSEHRIEGVCPKCQGMILIEYKFYGHVWIECQTCHYEEKQDYDNRR